MSASVHHPKDDNLAGVHPKIDPIRKLTHNRAADFTMNLRKRQRVRNDALESLFDSVCEPGAKDGSLLVADDTGGTIWRISYNGPPSAEHAAVPAESAGSAAKTEAAGR